MPFIQLDIFVFVLPAQSIPTYSVWQRLSVNIWKELTVTSKIWSLCRHHSDILKFEINPSINLTFLQVECFGLRWHVPFRRSCDHKSSLNPGLSFLFLFSQRCRGSAVDFTSTSSQRWRMLWWWMWGPSPRWARTSASWSTTTSRAWSSWASCHVDVSAPSTSSSASAATNAWSSFE